MQLRTSLDETVDEMLKNILFAVVTKGVCKRPGYDSDWAWILASPLVAAGVVDGELDEDGLADRVDWNSFNRFMRKAILET